MLRPKLVDTFRRYSWSLFINDSLAGLIVGVVALPLAIAFGIASGVTPAQGLITAIVAGFLISFLGGSRVQIGGPTGAFVVVVYGIIQQYGFSALLVATMMAGAMLVLMGALRLGSVIKFIPHSVITGFTSGIACVIFFSQLNDALGLGLKELPADFIAKLILLFQHIGQVNGWAVLIMLLTIGLIVCWPTQRVKLPGSLVAIIVSAVGVFYLKLPVETIGSRFGDITGAFMLPRFPAVDMTLIATLIKPAFAIAMLGAIESLLSAVVADGMIGGKHRSNMELVAQGVANIVTPFFGGIPATGAIARTAANIRNGGRTPVAGIVHAVTLLLILLVLGRLVVYIPLACLAGVLIVVAYQMSEWRSAVSIIKTSRSFGLVLITTFMVTVLFDLATAIELGLVLAAIIFIREMSVQTSVVKCADNDEGSLVLHETGLKKIPAGVQIYEIEGPLFFGAAYKFKEAIAEVGVLPRWVVLRMRHVPMIDSTGLHVLQEVCVRLAQKKVRVIFVGLQPRVISLLRKSNVRRYVAEHCFIPTLTQAMQLIKRDKAATKM